MKPIFRIFFGAENTRPFLVLTFLVLAGFGEAVGIGSLLPIIGTLSGETPQEATPFIQMFNDGIDAIGLQPTTTTLIVLLTASLCLKSVLLFAAHSYVGFSAGNVANGLRKRLIGNILNVNWRYFSSKETGRISNALSNDATRSGFAYRESAKFNAACIQVLVYVSLTVAIAPWVSLAGLGFGVLLMAVLAAFVRISRVAGYRGGDRTSDLVTGLTDFLANAKPLKSMERQSAFLSVFSRLNGKLRKALVLQAISDQAMNSGREIIVILGVGGGVALAIGYGVRVPELIVMCLLFYGVVSAIGRAQQSLQRAVVFEGSYVRLSGHIAEAAQHREVHPGTQPPSLKRCCRFENVVFSHKGRPVIRDVTFTIPVGEITLLQGSSGSGKTTLTDLLTGLYTPDSGRILIDGVPLRDIDIKQWRGMIGYVPQELGLIHDSVLMNITLGDGHITGEQVRQALIQADALNFVSSLPDGLSTLVGERGMQLSGGQRQRIAIARALVTMPKVLIFDEITSSLDPESERSICRSVETLAGDYAILAISHRPAWHDIATRTYLLDQGRITQVHQARAS